ncbi:MAG: type II toxin-antitoxin system RelE/ParE family toxin [Acidobacteriota bacterium]
MTFTFHPEAESEFEAARDFYDDREFGLGAAFLDEVHETIDRIADFRNSWPRTSHRARRCLFNRFPYSVIYRHTDTEITIYAVAHQSRKPDTGRID